MLCISESALCVASVCVFLNKPVCVPLAKPHTCSSVGVTYHVLLVSRTTVCWCHVPRSVGGNIVCVPLRKTGLNGSIQKEETSSC